MKQQIKKLCKQLGRFDFNDFAGILELPDEEVQKLLNELTSDKVIRQISGTEYAYIPVVPLTAQKEVPQMPPLTVKNRVLSPEELKPFNNEDQQKIFDEAPEYNQRHIIKCLNIFKLTNGLRGNELIKMLRYITQEYPEYKMGYNSYLRWKSEYARFGIRGLLKKPRSESNKFTISEELLSEYEEIFLSPKKYSMRVAWEILKSRHPDEYIQGDRSFNRALNKKYSKEYINKKRSFLAKIPEFKKEEEKPKKSKKKVFEKVKDAFNDYLKIIENKNDNFSVCARGYIKNHLFPFWGEYKFKDITQKSIITYQSKMLANGYSTSSIQRFISLFQKIIKKYSDVDNLFFSSKNTILPSIENRVLTDKNIKKIITDDNKIQDLWILTTGITPAELSALTYDDINYENKTVKISKVKFKDKAENIRAKYKLREINIPDILFDKISKNKEGCLFREVKITNFDLLLNTHIKLMLDKNVQINIISKNLGFCTLTEFENRYNFLLPQKLNDDFQIL